MRLTENHKRQILENAKKLIDAANSVREFEKKINSLKEENDRVIESLKEARKEHDDLVKSFNLDEEGIKDYNDFIQQILAAAMKPE